MEQSNIIIYNTDDGKVKVILYAKDGNIWMNQNQMAEDIAGIKERLASIEKILKEVE